MKKVFFAAGALALCVSSLAADCLQLTKDTPKVTWTAFKTPAKAGVNGTFTDTRITTKTAKNIQELMNNATFSINTKSSSTKDSARDANINKNFFSLFKAPGQITGKVLKVTDKKVNVAITLNNKTIEVPLNYTFENSQLVAKGTIDVFDFSLNDQLKKLNKACFALHEGKTWNDVNIEISATTQSTQCK